MVKIPMVFRRCRWAVLLAVVAIAAGPAWAGDWKGYMNVWSAPQSAGGVYQFRSFWGLPDVKTVVINGSGTGFGMLHVTFKSFSSANDMGLQH